MFRDAFQGGSRSIYTSTLLTEQNERLIDALFVPDAAQLYLTASWNKGSCVTSVMFPDKAVTAFHFIM